MTCRLVGLMSLVLLLSLAAFALLMSSYQAGVMEEVTRTVSAVGKATLQTFEMQAGASPGLQAPVETNGTAERRGEITYEIVQDSAGVKARMAPGGGVAILYLGEGPPSGAPESDLPTEKKMVHIRIAEVRAETDPVRGTVLRIPTWRVEKESLPAPGGPGEGILPVQAREAHFPARTDVVVNVPTADFQDLFAAFRRRTLILFLGILVVGTVLSAGLASRFTSPVRRLDAGIRRLTEGDLEVQVEADGRDVVYGDTDSVFAALRARDEAQAPVPLWWQARASSSIRSGSVYSGCGGEKKPAALDCAAARALPRAGPDGCSR